MPTAPAHRPLRTLRGQLTRLAGGACLLAAAACAQAAPAISARVLFAGTYGNGDVYVMLDTNIQEPGCAMSRFDVAGTSPSAKVVIATALAAMASGKTITVATVGCLGGVFPTLDNSRSSFFYLNVN